MFISPSCSSLLLVRVYAHSGLSPPSYRPCRAHHKSSWNHLILATFVLYQVSKAKHTFNLFYNTVFQCRYLIIFELFYFLIKLQILV